MTAVLQFQTMAGLVTFRRPLPPLAILREGHNDYRRQVAADFDRADAHSGVERGRSAGLVVVPPQVVRSDIHRPVLPDEVDRVAVVVQTQKVAVARPEGEAVSGAPVCPG